MGDPKRQRKKYASPRFPWSKDRIEEELKLLGEYGLRNKREILKYEALLAKYRTTARRLLAESAADRAAEEEKVLGKLHLLGVTPDGSTLDDVLSLTVKDFLERRLHTLAYKQGLGKSLLQSRQFIVHRHVAVAGRTVTVPGYLVSRGEESTISFSTRSPFSSTAHPIRIEIASK